MRYCTLAYHITVSEVVVTVTRLYSFYRLLASFPIPTKVRIQHVFFSSIRFMKLFT